MRDPSLPLSVCLDVKLTTLNTYFGHTEILLFLNFKPIHFVSPGGCDDTLKAHKEEKLMPLINPPTEEYDFDLIVIGGGSGGLAASKVHVHISHTLDKVNLSPYDF